MRLLICLAATLVVCRSHPLARVARGAPGFPHFNAVHHGYGATSYQNVHIENHGSVPIPTEDHHHQHHLAHHQHHVELLHVHEEPYQHHHPHHHHLPPAEIHEAIALVPATEVEHHHPHPEDHQYILVQKEIHEVPVHDIEHSIPVVENHDEHHQVILEPVPYPDDELQHIQLHDAPHYYAQGYAHDYEYH